MDTVALPNRVPTLRRASLEAVKLNLSKDGQYSKA